MPTRNEPIAMSGAEPPAVLVEGSVTGADVDACAPGVLVSA
jgi:hypothetical protein